MTDTKFTAPARKLNRRPRASMPTPSRSRFPKLTFFISLLGKRSRGNGMNNIRAAAPKAIPRIIITLAIAVIALGIPIAAYAQSNQQEWKQSPTGLNVTAGDNAGELDLTWDPHTQTSKTLSDYRVTWTPDGEAFKTNDQTEWYAYPTTNQVTVTGLEAGATYKVRVRARYDDGRKSNWSDVVSGQSGVTPNSPATGQPTISGTAEVGDTLTAGTSAIADDNGLTNAVFSHQWVRSTAGSHTDIPGATSASYVITSDDAESKVKLRVSFTDDDGYLETLTSAATASVPEPEGEQPQRDKSDGDDQTQHPAPATWQLRPTCASPIKPSMPSHFPGTPQPTARLLTPTSNAYSPAPHQPTLTLRFALRSPSWVCPRTHT